MGCHGGLSVPDSSVTGTEDRAKLDFPQAFASQGAAAWVANTGYGYGVDDAIAASEQLMLFFTQELGFDSASGGNSVGQALVNAKLRYAGGATFGGFSVFDEKAMIEATLYGLPMYTVTVPNPQNIGGSDVNLTVSGFSTVNFPGGTLEKITYEVGVTHSANDTTYGRYYSVGDEVQAWPGRPIQPRASFELVDHDSNPLQLPRGQILIFATYTDEAGFDPVVAIPLTQDSQPEPAFYAPGWYPSKLWSINQFGDQNRSTLVLGQFEPNQSVERLYSQLVLDTYYSADTEDYDPPLIWGLSSDPNTVPGEIGFAATVDDAVQVWVTVNFPNDGGGTLESFPLNLITPTNLSENEEPDLWEGIVALDPNELSPTEYYIQAMDAAGNVATASKEGFHVIGGGEPDAFQSIGTERTVDITLEYDAGDGHGYQAVENGTSASSISLSSVGSITSNTCINDPQIPDDGTQNGKCSVTITSSEVGDSTLEILFDIDLGQGVVTKSSYKFVTRWWAGTASIHKTFEEGPYTKTTPEEVCFSITPEGSTDGNEICLPGSSKLLLSWGNLPGGSYVMKETKTGSDFILMAPINFVIDAGHQDFRGPTAENKLKPVELQILKQQPGGAAWTDPEVTFEVFDCGADLNCNAENFLAANVTVPDPVSGNNPASVLLPEGKYLVVEISPTGVPPIEGDQVIELVAGSSGSLTFTNVIQGCSPGFWQGGTGSLLWDQGDPFAESPEYDSDWLEYPGGFPGNPYVHGTFFNKFFEPYTELDGILMMDLVNTGGASDDWQKAARNVVAAYLNASWGMAFTYSQQNILDMWSDTVTSEEKDFIGLHNELSSANKPTDGFCPLG
jgi:hypothetical protein